MNRALIIVTALAALLTLSLVLKNRSNEPTVENTLETEAEETVVSPVGDTIVPLIQNGDSLWMWNDTFMEFEFARFMSQEEIAGIPVKDSDEDGVINLSWKSLQAILYAKAYFEDYGMEVYIPAFPDLIKALDGKRVEVQGFTIPFDEDEHFVALSASPFANCFFCGKGSPSSVISLYLKDEEKLYKVDEFLEFEGTLRLNYDDPQEFYYILENAMPAKR